MHLQSARIVIEVIAGIFPGTPDEKHTKRWGITSEEWEGPERFKLFLERAAQANAYALYLQTLYMEGLEVNWTRTDFIWF